MNIEELQKENAILRGLLPALNAPCPYCGLTNIGLCRYGFPGCGYADDLLCGEDDAMRSVVERLHALEGRAQPAALVGPPADYVIDGIRVTLSGSDKLRIRLIDRLAMECYVNGEYDTGTKYGLRIYAEHSLVASVPPTFLTQTKAREWGDKLINTVRQ